jgi:hypothetical protein
MHRRAPRLPEVAATSGQEARRAQLRQPPPSVLTRFMAKNDLSELAQLLRDHAEAPNLLNGGDIRLLVMALDELARLRVEVETLRVEVEVQRVRSGRSRSFF